MTALLREVDFYQTRRNAKNVLKRYRRFERIAGVSLIDVRSPILSDIPKGPKNENGSEKAMLHLINAESERDAIVAGLMGLRLTNRQVLYYTFCSKDPYSNQRIADELGYSVRQIERMKSEALVEFAESYKKGKLIEYS